VKLILESESGVRATLENVPGETVGRLVSELLDGQGLVSAHPIGNEPEPKPLRGADAGSRLAAKPAIAPRRNRGTSKRAREIARDWLGSGEWRTKATIVKAWEREGLNVKTSEIAVRELDLERSRKGGRMHWRLKPPEEAPKTVAGTVSDGATYHGAWNGAGA
jgi:hypothetical protein